MTPRIGAEVQLKGRPLSGRGTLLARHPTDADRWMVQIEREGVPTGEKVDAVRTDFIIVEEGP